MNHFILGQVILFCGDKKVLSGFCVSFSKLDIFFKLSNDAKTCFSLDTEKVFSRHGGKMGFCNNKKEGILILPRSLRWGFVWPQSCFVAAFFQDI